MLIPEGTSELLLVKINKEKEYKKEKSALVFNRNEAGSTYLKNGFSVLVDGMLVSAMW